MSGPAPWLQTHWDWRAAGNFIGGGSGSGLLACCALASLAAAPGWLPVALGALLLAGGLGLVWLELGRPWRFLHVFFHPQTSWMTREALVALPLLACAVAAALTGWSPLLWLSGLLAVAFAYCQGRILRAARGIPAWRQPRILALILSTAASEGLGLWLLLAWLAPAELPGVDLLLAVAILVRAWAWRDYLRGLDNQAPRAALRALREFSGWLYGLGLAVPLALCGLGYALDSGFWLVLAGLCAAIAGWMMKFVIIRRAAYNQGYAIVHTAARGGGRAGPGCQPGW